MAAYRLYCLDGVGHISLADWIEADNAEDAITEARKLRPGAHRCELWLHEKLIARLNENGQYEREFFLR